MSQAVEPQEADYPMDPDFDPLDPDYLADPYPYYARFRREAPVFYAPKIDFWVVSRYEDILRIVKDPETFSNARVQEPLYPIIPEALQKLKEDVRVTPTTSTADPPLHRRTRKHAARAFSARRVAGLEGRIREVTNRLIDRMIPDGRADMVDGFAFPLPAYVVFGLIGYPEADAEMLKGWCSDRLKLTWGRPLPEEQLATVEKMSSFFGYIEGFVHERADDLRDDYTSDLLRIRAEDEDNLSLEEVVSIDYSLSFAGHETTTNLILNALRQLLDRPGLWDELREDPSLIPNAVEETLRRDTSVVSWRRSTTRPVEIAGVEVPEGARLMLLLASANRDEEVFEDPDAFDILRENANKHIAFSHGIHFCLGAAGPPGGSDRPRAAHAEAPRPQALPARPDLQVRPEHVVPWPEGAVGGVDARRSDGIARVTFKADPVGPVSWTEVAVWFRSYSDGPAHRRYGRRRNGEDAYTSRHSRGWAGGDAALAPAAPAGHRVGRARASGPRRGGDDGPGRRA